MIAALGITAPPTETVTCRSCGQGWRGVAEQRKHVGGALVDVVFVDIQHQDGEHIASKPADMGAVGGVFDQGLRRRRQNVVGHARAECLTQHFHAVDADDEVAGHHLMLRRMLKHLLDNRAEAEAVGQIKNRVDMKLIGRNRDGQLTLRQFNIHCSIPF